MLSDIKYNGVVRKEEIVWQKRNAQFLAYRELCIFVNKYF